MTWKEKTVAKILLIIARMITDNNELKVELTHLANHIGTSVVT